MEIIDDGLDLVVVVEIKVGKLEVFLKGIKEDLLVGVNVADKGKENVKGKCGIFSLSSGVDDVSLAEREKSGGGYIIWVLFAVEIKSYVLDLVFAEKINLKNYGLDLVNVGNINRVIR